MFPPLWWYPLRLRPPRRAWRPGPLRLAGCPDPIHAPGGLPILGEQNPFQYGSAVIDPGALFFRAGHAIGGPVESFRGIQANLFPFYESVLGSGAPLSPGLGIAGSPIYIK